MIIDERLSPVQTPSPHAEERLPTIRFTLQSGTFCDVTPSMSRAGCVPGETRILVNFSWSRQPTGTEMKAVQSRLVELGVPPQPEFVVESNDQDTSVQHGQNWLRDGTRPAA